MAKKSRRARRQSRRTAEPIRIPRPARSEAMSTGGKDVDFAEEYQYVVEDLRRIAVIALALMVLLIALAVLIG